MAMPGDTPIPNRTCSLPVLPSELSSILIELAFDQASEGVHRRRRVRPGCGDLNQRPGGGREHHQAHDRPARYGGAVLANRNLRVELPRGLDEAGRGAGVQPALVADLDGSSSLGGGLRSLAGKVLSIRIGGHRRASASSWEATLMYLRPASCAPSTARSSVAVWRRLASLISIGRLIPAMTSILPRSITEIARFDGVPPNISVSNTAPSPLSTSATQRRISCRRCSISSSGPMQTAAIWACAPTTCSSAATNSAASRPCVTKTIPIIENPLRRLVAGARRR